VAGNRTVEVALEASTRGSSAAVQLADLQRRAREIARELARAADDLARTRDHLAVTRDGLATAAWRAPGADRLRRDAQRARDFADKERRESLRLREAWRLPFPE